MCRCILFEPTKFDTEGLFEFGDVTYLFDCVARRPLKDHLLEGQIIERLQELDFDPEKDFIALSGAQLAVLILATAVVNYYGAVKMLAFNAVTQEYFERGMGHTVETGETCGN